MVRERRMRAAQAASARVMARITRALAAWPPGKGGPAVAWLGGLVLVALGLSAFVAAAPAAEGAGPREWIGDLSPIGPVDWSYERAAHLIERAGFGATPAQIERLARLTPREAIARLVDYEAIDNSHLPSFEESGIFDPGMDPFPKSRADAVRIAREHGEAMGVKVKPEGSSRRIQPVVNKFFYGLRADRLEVGRLGLWWAERMLRTRRPLEEKLALFWHGHFATSDSKVRDYRKMLLQNEMLRANATGNFRDLLLGIMKDPAMLVYLDNGENVKDHPNENFGRELLELFTMGVGNYTERDIREAARAFTGWTNDILEFEFDHTQHDFGEKVILGRTGRFDGEDVIDIILEQEATAGFIAAKLYRFFVRDDITPEFRGELGTRFRQGGYELKPLLTDIFLSRDFYSPASYATQIKSPVHLVVSTYRKLGLTELPTIPDFNRLTSGLGQSLLHPPNVAGWARGRTWITPATLLQRGNLFRDVLFPVDSASFRRPDRSMPGIYRRVGERLAQGMNITNATREGDAASNMLADSDEDYNTRYGGYMGYVMAYERVKLVPRHPVKIDLVAIIEDAGAETAGEVVDHLVRRFLRVPLAQDDREVLVDFLRDEIGTQRIDRRAEGLEPALRGLLYLILSAPEYQLG